MLKDIIVKKSCINKLGAFAKKKFLKGQLVLRIEPGRIVPVKDVKFLSPESERWDYLDFDHLYYMGDPEYYINHSCSPNVYVKDLGIYAMRDIKRGEELSFDYSINSIPIKGMAFPWKLNCKCGSKNCRKKIVGDFFSLNTDLQGKYKKYLDTWFKNKFAIKLKSL